LATVLLAAVFAPLRDRGISEVAAEVDATNSASNALLRGIGAQRTGGSIELVRRTRHSQRPGDPVTVGLIVAGLSEQDVAHDDTLLGEAPPGPEENQPGNPADPLALGLGGLLRASADPRSPQTGPA
jgi:hypothetical protein